MRGVGIKLVVLLTAIAIAAALLRGGSLRQLAALEIKHTWLVFVSLVIQLLGIAILSRGDGSLGWLLPVATGLPLAAFLILNRSLPGSWLIALGFSLNLLVIGLNRAMPVSPEAADSVGVPISRDVQGARHEVLTDGSALPWLADVIPIPALATVVSIGDIVLAAGVAYLVFRGASTPAGRVRTASG